MAQFMVVLDFTIVNVALPSIEQGLHIATSTVQWVVSGYAVTFGGFLLLGGRLADVFGSTKLYRLGLIVFVIASISGGLAVEPALLISSRLIQGVGASLLAPAGLSLLVTCWPNEQERTHALGVYGSVLSAGFASGAVLGGLLVAATWRLVFFVNAPIGLVLLVTSIRLLPPVPPKRRDQIDYPGAVAVTAGVAVLVLAVAEFGDTLRITQPALLGAVGIALLGAFVAWEKRARLPLVDLALFKDPRILGANLCMAGLGALIAGELIVLTLYLQDGRNLNPVLTGLCFVPQAVGSFLLSGPASKLVPTLGPRRGLAVAMAIALVALAGSAFAASAGSLVALLAALLLLGTASRLIQVSGTLAGTSGPVAARSEGTASGLLTATRQSGAALGVSISTAVLVAAGGTTAHRTEVAMLATSSFALAGLLSTLIIPRGPLRGEKPRPEDLVIYRAGGCA
jgi:EmrB/QacA subfamily drug resistance transporter